MKQLIVIKIGGNIIDDESKLSSFLEDFSKIKARKILVHGGGKMATSVAETMGVKQQMIDGRRITDAETLKVVTMVYAGYINKNIVAALQVYNCYSIGLTGADANIIKAHKRIHPEIDYGFVGDIDAVNTWFLQNFLDQGITPVFSSITHDKKGQLLNTNADTIAQEIAKAMSGIYETSLIYCFEKPGVLMDTDNDTSIIKKITATSYVELKEKNIITEGMIPKIDNAFAALNNGVKNIIIGKSEDLQQLIHQKSGTSIVYE